MERLFVSENNKGWTVCGPVFQELRPYVLKYAPYVKFHDFDTEIEEEFLRDNGKIIILSQVGDRLEIDKFRHVFEDNLNYYKKSGRRKNFFILLTAFEYSNNEIQEFNDILKVYFVPTFYCHYNSVIKVEETSIQDQLQFHFLSFNGRASLLRASLFCYFYRKNLLDKSIFSFLGYDFDSGTLEKTFQKLTDRGLDYYLNQYKFDASIERHISLNEVFDMIPCRIKDDNEVSWGGGQPGLENIDLYNQTFCHLVTETYKGQHPAFFTEKIFKPIAAKQPFMLFGAKQSLQFLRDIGFKTFSPFIDETYDTLDQPDRFNAILAEVDRISNLTLSELTELKGKMQSTVDFNYNHFYNTLPKMYQDEISSIAGDIDMLIQQRIKVFQR